jgi:DnaJ-class molecular chaperone
MSKKNETLETKKTSIPVQPEYSYSTLSSGWQLCPKCNGDGDLYRYNSPPFISTNCRPICDVCNGKKIISIDTGLPPSGNITDGETGTQYVITPAGTSGTDRRDITCDPGEITINTENV